MIVANPDKQEGTYQHGRIWYAQFLPRRQMIPVRMEYDTVFGEVVGYLAELTGQEIHLHFTGIEDYGKAKRGLAVSKVSAEPRLFVER